MCRRSWSISSWSAPRLAVALVLALLLASIGACGYHMSPTGEAIDSAVRTVFVENFKNLTSEAKAEDIFRSAFIHEVVRGGRFRIAANHADAQGVISGEIRNIVREPVSYDSDDLAQEERITVTLSLRFHTPAAELWSDRSFSDSEVYTVSLGDVQQSQATRQRVLAVLARTMAERAYSLMVSGF